MHDPDAPYSARGSAFGPVFPPGCIPPEIQGLIVEHDQSSMLTWIPQVEGTHYDVVSGGLLELRVDGGTRDAGCLANGLFDAEFEDPRPTPVGSGFYYLVRAQSACGSGSYGFEDPLIERAPEACP